MPRCSFLTFVPLGALLGSAIGCQKNVLDTTQDTEPPYVYHDTSPVEDSETGESAAPDDTVPTADTEDTGDPAPTIAGLDLYPRDLAVFPGATWSLRLVAEDDAGLRADVDPATATFASSDDGVVTVDAGGLVTALAEGEAELVASFGGLEARVGVEVIAPGYAEITALDAATGTVVAEPWGGTPDGTRVTGDASGVVLVPITEPGPATLSAWSNDHIPLSVVGTVNRRLRLPLRAQADLTAAGVGLAGEVDFGGVDPGSYSDVVVGLASASVPVHPLCFDLPDLLAADRTVSVWGVDLELPGNLFVRSYVEDWQGHTAAGNFGVWSLAGAVPIGDITAALNGDADVIDVLVDNLAAFAWGWSGGWSGTDGEALDVPVAPSVALTEVVEVTAPALSLGFSGDETPLVLLADGAPDGTWAVTGLGQGTGDVLALRVPPGTVGDGEMTWAVAMAQVDGLGSGYGMALSAGLVEGGAAVLPAFQEIPAIDDFSGVSRAYSFHTDARADLARVTLASGDGEVWDLCFPGGAQAGVLSKPQGYGFSYGQVTWTLTAVELTGDTFDGLVGRGAVTDEDLAPDALGVGRVEQDFAG